MTDLSKDCRECAKSYDGADGVLRCRPHSDGAKCTPYRASQCKEFVSEAGADAAESTRGWCAK